ncbi:YifB family Mg chelatase-like AAA ATPase [Agromyces sp. CFH 90414]|uniref:YifB family Mg chelatase-like AAA ATPase n=1 Tax=Agromyces agglutinans TaxID=2662258 RepID=A0A6I2F2P5_9MICO|nr:YifB family Mg chelatase-like AAA ATPase [Agromyces agglutinans]MRG58684.1 YifB family Mg chelatase-like AAA ATPase [Agromyces agglutinans]
MPVARTRAVALIGLAGSVVEVEADLASQLPGLVIIGLPDAALGEARERVRSAASNAGCPLPQRRLTVNLSPASLPKHGSGFDLAIALACLAAAGMVDPASVDRMVHLGELGLDGRVRPIAGVLPAVLAASRAGHRTVMVPEANAEEAALVPGVEVIAVGSLIEAAIRHGGSFDPETAEAFRERAARERDVEADASPPPAPVAPAGDLADVTGNTDAVQALLAAAAGGHHVFLGGPPGAGKTMLASRLPGILPDLDADAALEVASLRSLAGEAPHGGLDLRPPFVAPHHTASAAAIVGGGSRGIRPGAAPRASHGVLFLDEAPEFAASVLDVLRQPLEAGVISIHRANAVATFPARFQLVLAANPCPCGQHGLKNSDCTCPPVVRRRYLARLSGPLMDRIDVHLWVPRITAQELRMAGERPSLTSAEAKRRVSAAREAAAERLRGTPWRTNAEVPGPWLRGAGGLHPGNRACVSLDRALERGTVTMRGYDRVLKVAWSLADLDGVAIPDADHVGHALALRKGMQP